MNNKDCDRNQQDGVAPMTGSLSDCSRIVLAVDDYAQPHVNDVGSLAKKAAKWALLLAVARQLIAIATTMVVSRFVSPADTGTVGMVANLVAFVVLLDTGLAWATVQPKALTKEQVDGMFWTGVLIGSLLWLICVMAGPFLAHFYRNEDLTVVSVIMGLSPFFNSLTTQPSALLKRQLRQKSVNLIDTAALFFSSFIAIVMSIAHFGYWAIVGQMVSMQAFRFIFFIFLSGYVPSSPRFPQSALSLLKAGGILAISNYVCYFQLYLCGIIIGRLFGNETLGYYIKANGLKSLPTMYAAMVVTDVMVASLAALQSDHERMAVAYRKALILTAFVGCPAGAMLLPLAPEVVRFLYGSQWEKAVPFLKWLSLPAMLLPISTTTIWLFLSTGKIRQQLQMNIVLTISAVILYALALKFAKTAECVVMVEAFLFSLPFFLLNLIESHRAAEFSITLTLKIIAPIIISSIISAGAAMLAGIFLEHSKENWFLSFFIKSGIGIFVYVLLTLKYINPFPIPFIKRVAMRLVVVK